MVSNSSAKQMKKGGDKKKSVNKDEPTKAVDPRFAKIRGNHRFKPINKNNAKFEVDERFQSMFTNPLFATAGKVDMRGNKVNKKDATQEELRKFYQMKNEEKEENEEDEENEESEEEEEIDPRFSKQKLKTKQSHNVSDNEENTGSDEESPNKDDEELSDMENIWEDDEPAVQDQEDAEERPEHGDASNRIAIQNADWDKIKAVDFYVILSSFLPAEGILKSVTIYHSDLGLQRQDQENRLGPGIFVSAASSGNADDEGTVDKAKLLEYEKTRLKYCYAVAVFDSVATAQVVYNECDNREIGNTQYYMDMRFVPDDVEFTNPVKDVATESPSNYKTPTWYTIPFGHTKVECSWDQDDRSRNEVTKRKFSAEQLREMDFKSFLADDDDEDEEEEAVEEKKNTKTISGKKEGKKVKELRNKYQSLLSGLDEDEDKEEQFGDMEVTFSTGASEAAEKAINSIKDQEESNETAWEASLRRQKEKKKEKKKERKIAEQIEESEKTKKKKNKEKKQNEKNELSKEEEERRKAELELLMIPDSNSKSKKMTETKDEEDEEVDVSKKKGKKKGKKGAKVLEDDGFKFDLEDDRFKGLLESADYALDPTNPKFKKTAAFSEIMSARAKRRGEMRAAEEKTFQDSGNGTKKEDLLSLAESVKRKTSEALKQANKKPKLH